MGKRKKMFPREQPNFKRFRLSVQQFVGASQSKHDDDKSDNQANSHNRAKYNNRKEKRKNARKLKKERRLAFSQHKPMPTVDTLKRKKDDQAIEERAGLKRKEHKKQKDNRQEKKAPAKKSKKERDREFEKEAAFAAIKQEDRSIKQIEKLLKLNRRKSKSLPKAFLDDGLDYLLDAVTEDKVKSLYRDSDDDLSPGDEFEDDNFENEQDDEDEFELSSSESSEKVIQISKGANETLLHSTKKKSLLKKESSDGKKSIKSGSEKTVRWSDEVSEDTFSEAELQQSGCEHSDGETKSIEKTKAPVLKEDIYGRLRDEKGNIVKDTKTYVPPALRMNMSSLDEKSKLKMERLNKQLKGLVNRVSESNIQPISKQIEVLYMSHSHGQMNELLTSIIMSACVSMVMTPERLAMELMMLVAVLQHNVGSEVGAVLIQSLAKKFDVLYKSDDNHGNGKEVDNIVMLFAYLYNFKVIHSLLIFDLLKRFVDHFAEKDIELILLVLKHVGFSLRKDDPASLKTVIQEIQIKANNAEMCQFEDRSRVKFMLEILLAIKNNNMRKIPNYDPEHLDHLRKIIRNYLRSGSLGDAHLRIGLDDLLNAEEKGRWWVVGSAWEGKQKDDAQPQSAVDVVGDVSNRILALAQRQRMNTDIRKNIFCIIMTCEDFVDAFEKLLHLGLKNQQEREIIHVITDCCLQEKAFNPFYSHLLQKFCEYDRRFQMTFQYSLWDRFKEMGNLSKANSSNLANLLSHLLATKALSLSVLKAVEFGTLDKHMVHFLKQVLTKLLLDYPVNSMEDAFLRIAPLQKLHLLHEGLKLFMHHFLIKKEKNKEESSVLCSRVALAEKILSRQSTSML